MLRKKWVQHELFLYDYYNVSPTQLSRLRKVCMNFIKIKWFFEWERKARTEREERWEMEVWEVKRKSFLTCCCFSVVTSCFPILVYLKKYCVISEYAWCFLPDSHCLLDYLCLYRGIRCLKLIWKKRRWLDFVISDIDTWRKKPAQIQHEPPRKQLTTMDIFLHSSHTYFFGTVMHT